jgi:hypothetical protein
MAPRSQRQSSLSTHWGFHCTCSLCSSSEEEVESSNSRLSRISQLQKHLADWTFASEATPAMAEELISLYEEESLHAARATGHTLAVLAYNGIGDAKSAERHAKLALDSGMVSSGTDNEEEGMTKLLEDPGEPWSKKYCKLHILFKCRT